MTIDFSPTIVQQVNLTTIKRFKLSVAVTFTIVWLTFSAAAAQATPPQSCATLKNKLSRVDSPLALQSVFSSGVIKPLRKYRRARKFLFSQVAPLRASGSIEALYTGKQKPKQKRVPSGFNCEHLWPRAWMSKRGSSSFRKQEADLHNLFPSEIRVNSRRGHLPFGEVKRVTYRAAAPSKIGLNVEGKEVVDVRIERRGDVARSLIYMAARWSLAFPRSQSIAVLSRWSKSDPPDEGEQRRDQRITQLQGNSNPLVSCPELTDTTLRLLARFSLASHSGIDHQSRSDQTKHTQEQSPADGQPDTPSTASQLGYYWMAQQGDLPSDLDTIEDRFPAPYGALRESVSPTSFAAWLRGLPLSPKGSPVLLFNGDLKGRQDVHEAVINIDIGKRDRQQCADAAIRFRAEYLYARERARIKPQVPIHFNYTTGDRISFKRWAKGQRPRVKEKRIKGRRRWEVTWRGGKRRGRSYSNFRAYLDNIFSYAGTASLSAELPKRSPEQIRAGDLYLQGGFPGHAVIVIDVADHPTLGRLMLLAQSYMPAQSPHILKNPSNPKLSPWYQVPASGMLITPEWVFKATDLHRFRGHDRK